MKKILTFRETMFYFDFKLQCPLLFFLDIGHITLQANIELIYNRYWNPS